MSYADKVLEVKRQNLPGGLKGGLYRPLSDSDVKTIIEQSMRLLEHSGIHVYSSLARRFLQKAGATVASDGKTVFLPKSMVEDAIASAPSSITLYGRKSENNLVLEGSRVYYGTGGTAINVIDLETGDKRPSILDDVKLNAKVMDALDYIHLFTINVFPTDIEDKHKVDINRFYWSLKNTSKHVMGGVYSLQGTKDVVEMATMIAGSKEKLAAEPFISFITLIISPFKIDSLYGDIACLLAEQGLPVVIPTEPVCGTTSPITLASNVLIHIAETLSGVTLVQSVKKGAPVIAGSVGSVSNLRTMSMLTGAVERGMINSATAQIAQHLSIPFYSTAGNSDSKIEDAQAGIESAVNNLLVGMSGANYIHDAAGLLDQDLTVSYDKLVIDNEILGMCMRVLKGIEVNEDTLGVEMIERVGPGGDFLAEEHTIKYMHDEFFKSKLADRDSYNNWKASGRKDMRARAREQLNNIINTHKSPGIDKSIDILIREKFSDIRI
jgi:trimethylamine---corrinoid protein Co-methyltransferase